MDKYDIKRMKSQLEIIASLEKDLSSAIAEVLKRYGVTGEYSFNVIKTNYYSQEPVKELKKENLMQPLYCLGSGISSIEDPKKIIPI